MNNKIRITLRNNDGSDRGTGPPNIDIDEAFTRVVLHNLEKNLSKSQIIDKPLNLV